MSFLPPSSCFHCFIICIPATEAMTSDIHDHLPLDSVAIYTEICANYINTRDIPGRKFSISGSSHQISTNKALESDTEKEYEHMNVLSTDMPNS